MNFYTELRNKTGFSQQQLADYTGVSRSLYNMAERNLRELPTQAFLKLVELDKQIGHIKTGKVNSLPLPEPANKEMKKYHKRKMDDCLFKAMTLERKLETALRLQRQSKVRLSLTQELTKSKNGPGKTSPGETWAGYHKWKADQQLSKKNPAIQKMIYELEVARGYAAVHEKILKKIS